MLRRLAALALIAARTSGAQSVDPVTADPAVRDTANPASLEELAIPSGGARMNGFLLVAQGAGPHPTVLLLHGYPGNERNLDVAQALRRAGMNVLYFDYRGSWGSGGTFSFANAQADVTAALRYIRSPDASRKFRADPRRVALVGHSMGGWLALLTASADSSVACVGGIEFSDMTGGHGATATREQDSTFREYTQWLTAPGAPLRGDARTMLASLRAHPEWILTTHAPRLAGRPVLLLDNDVNPYHDDLVTALRSAGARRLTEMVWQTDHSFNDRRIELARAVVSWTRSSCGFQ